MRRKKNGVLLRCKEKKSMYKNAYKKNKINEGDHKSLLFWFSMILVSIFLIVAPYQIALFNGNTITFEGPIYTHVMLGSILLFCLSLYIFFNWKQDNQVDYMSIFIWLIPISYLISFFQAVAHYPAKNMIFINLMLVALFLTGVLFAKSRIGSYVLAWLLLASSYSVVVFGFMNWFGLAKYNDAVMHDGTAIRLTSVFQYANSYTAYLLGIIFCSLLLTVHSKRWYITFLNSLILVPAVTSLFLTLSRGGLIAVPIILILILILISFHKQLLLNVYFVISIAASLTILNSLTMIGEKIYEEGNSTLSLQGISTLAVATIIASIIITVIHLSERYLNEKLNFKFSRFIFPVIIVIIGFISIMIVMKDHPVLNSLPENLANRIKSINSQESSIYLRSTFTKDALTVVEQAPVFGSGGGGWASLYESYKAYPYISRQAHNFFLQYAVEVGIVGLLVLLIILFSIYYRFISQFFKSKDKEPAKIYLIFYAMSISLIIHSALDFDMSYIYLAGLFFLCLGGLTAAVRGKSKFKLSLSGRWRKLYPGLITIVSLVMFFQTAQMVRGHSYFQEVSSLMNERKSFNEIANALDSAIRLNPHNSIYEGQRIALYTQAFEQTKDTNISNLLESYIQEARKYDPNNKILMDYEFYYYLKTDLDKAIALSHESLEKFPWEQKYYDQLINLYFQKGDQARTNNNKQQMIEYWAQSLNIYQRLNDKIAYLGTLPKGLDMQPFRTIAPTILAIGQIHYIQGEFAKASDVLRLGLSDDLNDSSTLMVTRWYLAALEKQNKEDPTIYQQLMNKDPNESQEVQKIVNLTF